MATSPENGLRSVPIGTGATGGRTESDSLGELEVPAQHYWGAQTQRSLSHFAIGEDRMPTAVYHAYGYVKKAAALINGTAGRLDRKLAEAIVAAADEVIAGELDSEFPLYVWQTGSGTQSQHERQRGDRQPREPAVGRRAWKQASRSSRTTTSTWGSPRTTPSRPRCTSPRCSRSRGHAGPRVDALADAIWNKAVDWVDVVKIGRTHLQDATPLTVGQEWSGWATQLRDARARLERALEAIHELAAGGTAVGTGLNAPEGSPRRSPPSSPSSRVCRCGRRPTSSPPRGRSTGWSP